MEGVGLYAIIAAIIAAFGFWIGHKSKDEKPAVDVTGAAESKEIMDDHAEEVAEAGADYSNSMARPVDERVRDILDRFRKRTSK